MCLDTNWQRRFQVKTFLFKNKNRTQPLAKVKQAMLPVRSMDKESLYLGKKVLASYEQLQDIVTDRENHDHQ